MKKISFIEVASFCLCLSMFIIGVSALLSSSLDVHTSARIISCSLMMSGAGSGLIALRRVNSNKETANQYIAIATVVAVVLECAGLYGTFTL